MMHDESNGCNPEDGWNRKLGYRAVGIRGQATNERSTVRSNIDRLRLQIRDLRISSVELAYLYRPNFFNLTAKNID